MRTLWPGATAHEVEEQVTDRIEKKLQETPDVDVIRSYSKPGESLVFFTIKDSTPTAARCRRPGTRCARRSATSATPCPPAIQGPYFNDEFGDTFGNIYAFTGDGFAYAELKKYVDRVRQELLRVPDVAKVELDRRAGREDLHRALAHASSRRSASIRADDRQRPARRRTRWRRRAASRPRPTGSTCA